MDMDERAFNWKNLIFLLTGVLLFAITYFSSAWPPSVDSMQ